MIVCLCAGISDRDIRAAAAAGTRRCADVFRGKDRQPRCGACIDLICDILGENDGRDTSGCSGGCG